MIDITKIKNLVDSLAKQMSDSKTESYKVLDDIPSTIKFMGQMWIEDITKKLEAENLLVEDKLEKVIDYIKKEMKKHHG